MSTRVNSEPKPRNFPFLYGFQCIVEEETSRGGSHTQHMCIYVHLYEYGNICMLHVIIDGALA